MKRLVLMVVALATVAGAGVTNAAPSAPKLSAAVRDDGAVRVRWSLSGNFGRSSARLEIERSTDGGAFENVADVAKPRRRHAITDKPGSEGTFTYQARIVSSLGTSPWSAPVSVTVGDREREGEDGGDGGGGIPSGMSECPSDYAAGVLEQVNAFRRITGAQGLTMDARLNAAALAHSIYMAQTGNTDHAGALQEMLDAGYQPSVWGQNIAWGFSTPSAVVNAWWDSPVHKANMTNRAFRDTGIGCVRDTRGRIWWTQDFGG